VYAFIYTNRQPVTISAHSHLRYETEIKTAFRKYWPLTPVQQGQFYGIVYYFHKKPNQIDADNLSKPVFDALKNELYVDDKHLRIVRSGVFDLKSANFDLIDITKMPDNVIPEFLAALDSSDHILYVEIGDLSYGMFEFGCE